MRHFVCAAFASLLLVAAAPLPDAQRDRILADARATGPDALSFDRTTRSVRTGGGSTTTTALVERWDGKRWTLISQNGKRPTQTMRERAAKQTAANPVPGYHLIAGLLAVPGESVTDAQGRTVLSLAQLPRGTVRTDSGDISDHLRGEITIVSRAGKCWVERVRFVQRESFKMNLLIRVNSFEQVLDYKLDDKGMPRLASQTATSAGTMFGFPGGENSQVPYTKR
jgi:hypothetical protein